MAISSDVMKSYTVKTGGAGISASIPDTGETDLPSISAFFDGTAGGAWDFTKSSKLYQDSSRTTPVTAANDLVGSATDDSGNGNNLAQATAAAKCEWIQNSSGTYGISAIDAGDLLQDSISGSNDSMMIVYMTNNDGTTTGQPIWQFVDGNVSQGIQRYLTTGELVMYRDFIGVTRVTIKASPTTDEEVTVYHNYDSSATRREAQYNDETQVVNTTGASGNYGNTVRVCHSYTGVVHRAIFIRKYCSADELAEAKSLVLNGWSA